MYKIVKVLVRDFHVSDNGILRVIHDTIRLIMNRPCFAIIMSTVITTA